MGKSHIQPKLCVKFHIQKFSVRVTVSCTYDSEDSEVADGKLESGEVNIMSIQRS